MRAIVISNEAFPRESAGANYIQYFSMCLMELGYNVLVLGKNKSGKNNNGGTYHGIEYTLRENHESYTEKLYFNKNYYKTVAKQFKFCNNDVFFFYNTNPYLFDLYRKMFPASKMYYIRVEDLQPYQFKLGKYNPRFLLEKKAIAYAYKNMNGILSISTVLSEQDKQHGCRSIVLPIMADPFEYGFVEDIGKDDIVNFIYPGMKTTGYEDDIALAFSSFASLPSSALDRVRIHITGTSKDKMRSIISDELYQKMQKNIILYGFLQYEELVSLFQKMNYIVLIRKINKITIANFPSKVPECLGYGIIPVCTEVGDYTEYYLNDENAIIIRGTSIKDCASAILKAVDLPQEKYEVMRNAARKTAVEKFYYKRWAPVISSFLNAEEVE